jgi:hypothetical protein
MVKASGLYFVRSQALIAYVRVADVSACAGTTDSTRGIAASIDSRFQIIFFSISSSCSTSNVYIGGEVGERQAGSGRASGEDHVTKSFAP